MNRISTFAVSKNSSTLFFYLLLLTLLAPVTSRAQTSTGSWRTLTPAGGAATAREENAYVQAGNKFYLIGGRGIKPVQVYDLATRKWSNKANTPIELHHFQAITLDGLIYIIGAFTGRYPHETPVPNVYIYNPLTDKWLKGASIPSARRRGGAGAVVYNKKIYLVAGILDGHWDGHVNWFDEYDPATNAWKVLDNAPRSRDHFHAAVVNNKIYVASGRRSSARTGQTFSLTVPEVDVYDFTTANWSTLPSSSNLPTRRAGAGTVAIGNELIVMGGESTQPTAHRETEALNVTTNRWRRLADMKQGRHGMQAIVSNNGIYVAVGAGNQGGTGLLASQEAFYYGSSTTPTGAALAQSALTAPTSADFGPVAVNATSTKTVTITNSGSNQAVVVTAVSVSGTSTSSFSYTAPYSLPVVIPVGKSLNVSVRFKPTSTGTKTASLTVTHSGTSGNKTISLSGSGGSSTTSNKVTSFTLINANTNQSIQTLTDGSTINLATLPTRSLNIRANTSPAQIGSVVLALSGAQTHTATETLLPYALFGDDNGDYNAWTPAVGSYTLRGTPYSGSKGSGTAGPALTVSFRVINQTTASRVAVAEILTTPAATLAYPNPSADGRVRVPFTTKMSGEVTYRLLDPAGKTIASGIRQLVEPTSFLPFDFSRQLKQPGVYYLQLEGPQLKTTVKLVRE